MINCPNCNTQVPEGTKFCPNCGAQIPEMAQPVQHQGYVQGENPYQGNEIPQNSVPQGVPQQNTPSFEGNVPQGNYGPGPVPYSGPSKDNDKLMGILSYLGILCLIPTFGAKDSEFARFHANQGLPLAILGIGFPILKRILSLIFYQISFSFGLTMGGIMATLGGLISLYVLVMSIIGIVNVCNNEQKELPLTGKIKILK